MDYSVITICLNSADTIRRTIESVFSQSISPKEYIFVDGGSQDGTLDLLETSIEQAKSAGLPIDCRVIHQRTMGGIPEAWNMGLREASAHIVSILNSDDWYEGDAISTVLHEFESDPALDIFCGSVKVRTSFDAPQFKMRRPRPFSLFPVLMPVLHPASFVKKSAYNVIGNFNVDYKVSADYDFMYRAYRNGLKLVASDRILANHLMGGFAQNNRKKARRETHLIGLAHTSMRLMPDLAFVTRCLLNR